MLSATRRCNGTEGSIPAFRVQENLHSRLHLYWRSQLQAHPSLDDGQLTYAPPSAQWQKKQEGVVETLSGTEDSILLFLHALMLNRSVVNAADPALDGYRKYLVSERGCTEAEATEFLQTAEVHRALRELELIETETHPQLKDFKHSMEEELPPYAVLPDGSREYVRDVSREEADKAVSEAVDRLMD